MKAVLIEDDAVLNRTLKRVIEKHYNVMAFTAPVSAVEYIAQSGADVVVSDIRMPDMSGFDVLERLKTLSPDTAVILMTGQGSIDESVRAIKSGAFDYIPKPVETELLIYKLDVVNEKLALKALADTAAGKSGVVAVSAKMEAILNTASRVAKTGSNVLITGETGTGKEVLARYIHENSERSRRPFAAINCCNLQQHLFESELFGHKKGAFTGADSDRKGIIQSAYGGSLFLDEIGEMPLDLQPKFLRFLETKSFYPVGCPVQEQADVRIIAATNRDLSVLSDKGGFRQDLFYRLNVINIELPPLRERREDILPLAHHFMEKFKHINTQVKGIHQSALLCLQSYDYPGNIRELSNIIERAMILEQGDTLGCESLNLGCPVEADTLSLDSVMKRHILKVLDIAGGNRQKAAEILGVDASTVYRKLKEYGIG